MSFAYWQAVEAMFYKRSSETALGIGHMLQLAQAQIERRLLPIKVPLYCARSELFETIFQYNFVFLYLKLNDFIGN